MFEEAKRRYLEHLQVAQLPSGVDALTNYNSIIQEIESIAKRHAAEYFRAVAENQRDENYDNDQDIRFQRIVETYKLLIVPDSTLQGYLHCLGKETARREFRRAAMLVHPDKNAHPQAKIAFQKLYHHFKGVLSDSE